MRTPRGSIRAHLRFPQTLLRACIACVPLLAFALAPGQALAGSHGTQYALRISEGEINFPEYESIASTSGSSSTHGQVVVSIIRAGVVVYRDKGEEGWADFSQVPEVGDEVTLEAPQGNLIARTVYDGLPTMEPTVCAGSTDFSGANSPGDVVEGSYNTPSLVFGPYGEVRGVHHSGLGEAQVKTLSGTTFGGSFLAALSSSETVTATETLKTPLAGEATYTYTSETSRPVGACPVVPPVVVPIAAPVITPALGGSILSFLHNTVRSILKLGWRDQVSINQAGTVVQDLYGLAGHVPAYAARRGRHHSTPPAVLLARGTVSADRAGTVTVTLRLTRAGRRELKDAAHLHAMLLTTLRGAAGPVTHLARRKVTLRG
jgi:hypothetical protein